MAKTDAVKTQFISQMNILKYIFENYNNIKIFDQQINNDNIIFNVEILFEIDLDSYNFNKNMRNYFYSFSNFFEYMFTFANNEIIDIFENNDFTKIKTYIDLINQYKKNNIKIIISKDKIHEEKCNIDFVINGVKYDDIVNDKIEKFKKINKIFEEIYKKNICEFEEIVYLNDNDEEQKYNIHYIFLNNKSYNYHSDFYDKIITYIVNCIGNEINIITTYDDKQLQMVDFYTIRKNIKFINEILLSNFKYYNILLLDDRNIVSDKCIKTNYRSNFIPEKKELIEVKCNDNIEEPEKIIYCYKCENSVYKYVNHELYFLKIINGMIDNSLTLKYRDLPKSLQHVLYYIYILFTADGTLYIIDEFDEHLDKSTAHTILSLFQKHKKTLLLVSQQGFFAELDLKNLYMVNNFKIKNLKYKMNKDLLIDDDKEHIIKNALELLMSGDSSNYIIVESTIDDNLIKCIYIDEYILKKFNIINMNSKNNMILLIKYLKNINYIDFIKKRINIKILLMYDNDDCINDDNDEKNKILSKYVSENVYNVKKICHEQNLEHEIYKTYKIDYIQKNKIKQQQDNIIKENNEIIDDLLKYEVDSNEQIIVPYKNIKEIKEIMKKHNELVKNDSGKMKESLKLALSDKLIGENLNTYIKVIDRTIDEILSTQYFTNIKKIINDFFN